MLLGNVTKIFLRLSASCNAASCLATTTAVKFRSYGFIPSHLLLKAAPAPPPPRQAPTSPSLLKLVKQSPVTRKRKAKGRRKMGTRENTLLLFDVDGTLTPSRLVRSV